MWIVRWLLVHQINSEKNYSKHQIAYNMRSSAACWISLRVNRSHRIIIAYDDEKATLFLLLNSSVLSLKVLFKLR